MPGLSGFIPYATKEDFLHVEVIDSLTGIHEWMHEAGVEVSPLQDCIAALKTLVKAMVQHIHDHIAKGKRTPHPWFSHPGKEGDPWVVQSGTEIQECVITRRPFVDLPIHSFMYMYVHCALKICNEAVVEGFGSVLQRHAIGMRNLFFDIYAKEGRIAYNAPHPARSEKLLLEALQHYFKEENYKHKTSLHQCFHRQDTNLNRLPTRVLSTMLHRMINKDPLNDPYSLSFME